MAGRKPKPTAVKKLEGNPGKRKLNTKEPNPGKGMPDCPAWLMPEAKTEWIRLSEKLNQMGVLTEIDRSVFAAYCQSYARWKEAQEHINSEGATYETENGMQRPNPWVAICNTEQRLMMQAASEFGLTPSARSRIMAASGVGKVNILMLESHQYTLILIFQNHHNSYRKILFAFIRSLHAFTGTDVAHIVLQIFAELTNVEASEEQFRHG